MQVFQPTTLDEHTECPYLPERSKQYRYFLAGNVTKGEMDELLHVGWRKFGIYFFSPACFGCRQCVPVRIPVGSFSPSRSQRRIWRKNSDVRVEFKPLTFSPAIFEIYSQHSVERFGQETSLDEFLFSFFLPSCPSLQAEYYLGEQLIGVGFLDYGQVSLSSVYFAFDPHYSARRLGTFSVLKEIEFARSKGFHNYYLGYFVPGCSRMLYKSSFLPCEFFSWEENTWLASPRPNNSPSQI